MIIKLTQLQFLTLRNEKIVCKESKNHITIKYHNISGFERRERDFS